MIGLNKMSGHFISPQTSPSHFDKNKNVPNKISVPSNPTQTQFNQMAVNSLAKLSTSASTSTLWPHLCLPTFPKPHSSTPNKFAKCTRIFAMANTTATKIAPAVIVGGGRVGRALQEMGSGQDLIVKRGEPVPLDFEGPIFVCTRNDDLEAVLEVTPKSRWNGKPPEFLLIFKLELLFIMF